ncbi:TatD family hydrolase [Candidatus Acetothermia bacterium]|nr:TatD family hydrolase [Candidatus Acetothermia bacterium]MBI3660441.1 TatD family hydrolase [Candidatus Acetothermia bacterium]
MLIDTHAHLDDPQFDHDRELVIKRARDASIEIITIGTNLQTSTRALEISQKYDLHCAVGIHPHDSARCDEKILTEIEQLAVYPEVVAIGEFGLDYFKNYEPHDVQKRAFEMQLELVKKLNKPIVIHQRAAEEEIFQTLSQHSGLRGVIHSFTSTWEWARKFLDLGFYISVNGIVTFAKDAALREALEKTPLNRLLLETDCPYLAPPPHRGKRNEPLYVQYVAAFVAHLKNLPSTEVVRTTTENAKRLFDLR